MKHYLKTTVLTLLVLMLSGCANTSKTDWDLYELNGNVKSYTENYYEPVKELGEWKAGKPEDYRNYRVQFSTDGVYEQMEFLGKDN
ncbi:MAG: hypothetical protein AAF617_10130, partial [Bacteroidota bacterium]